MLHSSGIVRYAHATQHDIVSNPFELQTHGSAGRPIQFQIPQFPPLVHWMQVASRSSSQICTAALRHFTRSFHSSPQAFPLLFHATRLRTAPKLCQFEFITARQVRDFSIFRARQTQTQTRGDGRTTTSTNPPKSRTAPATPATSDVTERKDGEDGAVRKPTIRENIYTIPNLLTVSRIFACPVLGWSILQGDFVLSTSLLVYAGVSDLVRLFPQLPICSLSARL